MSKPPPYYYTVDLIWTEGKKGALTAEGLPRVEVAIPPEFGGPAGFWSPEQLFVASASACIMATFIAVAANSRLEFKGYASSAIGKVEKTPSGLAVTEVVVKPRVSVAQERDRDRAARVLQKAEENCLVSRSMKTRVIVEPEIVID